MSRTFSLARLMVGVTLFCVTCAVAVKFPEFTFGLVAFVAFNVPTACVFFALSRFYNDSAGLFFRVFIGAMFGWIMVPGVVASGGWEGWLITYAIAAGPPALGALILAAPAVVIHQVSRLQNQKPAPDTFRP